MTPLKEKGIICFLFLFVPLLRTNLTLDPSQHLQMTFLSAGLLIYWLISFKIQSSFSFNNRASKILLLSYFTYILYSLLSVAIPANFADAFYVFLKTGLYFVVLLTFAFIIRGQNTITVLSKVVLLLSSLLLAIGYFQLITLLQDGQLSIPHSTYQITSIFAHRNLFAETLTFTLPFTIYQLITNKKTGLRTGATLNLSLTLILLILLSNRASWLAVIVAALTVAALMAIKQRSLFKTFTFKYLSITILASLAAGTVAAYQFSDKASFNHHVSTSFNPHEGSTSDRLKLWDRSVQLIAEKPMVGHGLDTWKMEMLKYGSKDYETAKGEIFYQRPHNDFLWVTAEQGVIGGSLYLLFFLMLSVLAILTYIQSSNTEGRHTAILAVTTIVLYGSFSMLSFPKEILFHNILLFSIAGVLVSKNIQHASKPSRSKIPYTFLISTSLLVSLLVGLFRLYGDVHTKKALEYRQQNKPQQCIRHINRAQSVFYSVDATSTPLDWYAGAAWFQLKNYKQAMLHFEKAYALNPYHLFVINDYAGSLFKNGQTKEAIQKYLEVIQLAPKHLDSRLNLCALYFKQNNLPEAFEIIAKTEPDEESDRYQQTLLIVASQFIDQYLIDNRVRTDNYFWKEFQDNKENYYFYKTLVFKYQKHNGDSKSFMENLIHDNL
ncbi:MAG: O-antigen ligase family protein [Bacteroidales bacterium]|nr:O-antigen ligase family protein [Bacteroidales bacterium]